MTIDLRFFLSIVFVLTFILPPEFFAQEIGQVNQQNEVMDKCGFSFTSEAENLTVPGDHWGYGYDSLLADLQYWKQSPYIKVDSIGNSVQGRPLWQLTISENPYNVEGKRTVHVHARTHPQETQGFWVTDQMINFLKSETQLGQLIRTNCVFYIIPMFNPDGVELELPRNNANGIDLESNWFTTPNQPEVAALKNRFIQLMASPHPIEVALNMHSSSLCKRYFVYHDSAGTSPEFAIMQQNFIEGIRSYFPGGIEPWNYFVSWTNGTPLKYPESWFWINHGESVMALTYEDMYCEQNGKYDSTANAILRGLMDYMGISTNIGELAAGIQDGFELNQNYPNPFNPSTKIKYQIPASINSSKGGTLVILKVYDLLGKELVTLVSEEQNPGMYEVEFDASDLSSGIYIYQLRAGGLIQTKKMVLIR
ncbi:MAG: T9SS type A sorting domain-containing protein [Ignavibacteriaceae bacterium]|nr:T9SS type A sorting domain-containing protein [Ignavibacteriaceae bacterium]